MTLWAAFGPYETAEDAENNLRRACRAVFRHEWSKEHEGWFNGHVDNFRTWQEEGHFLESHELMRKGLLLNAKGPAFQEASLKIRADALVDAQAAADLLGKDFPALEERIHKYLDHERTRLSQQTTKEKK